MSTESTLRIAFQELRALAENAVDSLTTEDYRHVVAALETWLRSHCANCGVLLDRERRRRRDDDPWCLACEAAFLSPPTDQGDGDLPF